MINRRSAALIVLLAPLAACVSGSDSTASSPNSNTAFEARFSPLFGIMPFPNDLYFNGSTTGTLNIPASATITANAPLAALNHLDGYGTQSDISIYFTQQVDPATVAANVVVLKVDTDPATKAVNPAGTVTPLVPGTDYSIGLSPGSDVGGTVVTIKPLKPLTASTVVGTTAVPGSYLVIVKTGVKDMDGNAVSPSADFSSIVTADLPAIAALDVTKINMAANNPLLPVAQFTFPQLLVAAGAGITPDKVAVTFSFSTAYLGISLAELAVQDITSPPGAQPVGVGTVNTGKTVCDVLVASGQLPSTAACAGVPGSTATAVYAGTVALPYYLPVPGASNPTAALTGFWKNAAGGDTAISATDPTSFIPKPTRDLATNPNIIPMLVTIPTGCGAMPGAGWPVVIFQHGITRNREDVFGIASTFGSICMATVAIDLPLHGVTDKNDPFYTAGHERTFDMDLENNTTGAAGPDGAIDTSGAWFINLNSTITSRDNLREGAADLINLTAALPTLFPGGTNSFDTSKVFFLGHSLGGIVGTSFLGADSAAARLTATAPKVVAATLASPGGHIAELLRNSVSFEPVIDAGLAANGLVKGTQSYYDFYSEAQAVVEDGDPANYATAAAAGHPIHMLEVVGNGGANEPDKVVPNSATDLLTVLMGLTGINTAGPHALAAAGGGTLAQFTAGDHGSILDPTASAAVTTEMQSETASVFGSGGTAVVVTDASNLH